MSQDVNKAIAFFEAQTPEPELQSDIEFWVHLQTIIEAARPQAQSSGEDFADRLAEMLEKCDISIDISTGQQDAGRRAFSEGKIFEAMDNGKDRYMLLYNGYINEEPNPPATQSVKQFLEGVDKNILGTVILSAAGELKRNDKIPHYAEHLAFRAIEHLLKISEKQPSQQVTEEDK